MAYTSIFKTKEKQAVSGGYKSIFGIKEKPAITFEEPRKQTLPEFLGGGSYTSIFSKPDKLVKTKAEYGLVPTKEGEEGHHIFPVSLGGLSEAYNFKALGIKDHARITKVGNKALEDYRNGMIDLPQARLKVMTKYQEILDEKKGIKQGMKANLWAGVKQVFTDIGEKFAKDYKEKKDKTPEEKEKEYATRSLAGYEGRVAQEREVKKMEAGTSLTTSEDVAILTKKSEEETEKIAKIFIAPVRYTAGELAKAITSYSLERANSDLTYDPRSDTEKLLVGEDKIQRLTKQEDMYGMIARGVGIPAALITMAVVENPFLTNIGITAGIKNLIKKKAKKEAGELVIKLGADELYKLADDAIKAELNAGKITKEEAKIAIEEITKMKKPKPAIPKIEPEVKPKIKPITKAIPDEPIKLYHGTESSVGAKINKEGLRFGDFLTANKDEALDYAQMRAKQKGTKPIIKEFTFNKNEVSLNTGTGEWQYKGGAEAFGGGKYPEQIYKALNESWGTNMTKKEIDALPFNELRDNASMGLKGGLEEFDKLTQATKAVKEVAPEIKIKPTIKKVPREQLPVGEGAEKISRLEARTKNALKKTTQEDIDNLGLATYKQVNNKENIAKASKYVVNNTDEAMEVLKGNIQAPKGILDNSIFVAMDNLAKGDVNLARKLASLKSTRFGQELSVLRELNVGSPVRKIEEIIQIREKAVSKKLKGKTISQAKKDIAKEIKIVKPNKSDWATFIKNIEC